MLKTFISYDNVFWNNYSVDKPSKHYLDNITWVEVDYDFNVHDNKLTVYTSDDKIRLIKVVNDDKKETRYYHFEKREWNKTNYTLTFNLDYWLTYTLNLTQENISILCERHQDYDNDNNLNFHDDTGVDLSQDSFTCNKSFFKTTVKYGQWKWIYDDESFIRVVHDDPLNQMYCLVLNSDFNLSNQGRCYIPIFAKSGACRLHIKKKLGNDYLFNISSNTNIRNTINIPNTINQWVDNLDQSKSWVYRIVIETQSDKFFIYVDNLKNVNYLRFLRFIDNGMELTTADGTYLLTNYDENDTNVNVYAVAEECFRSAKLDMMNNYNTILEKSKTDFVKKIDGLYIIPNILNLTNLCFYEIIKNDNYVVLKLNLDGNPVDKKLKLFKDLKIDKNYRFNNENIQFKYILKLFNVNYLNNEIDISKYWKDDNVELDYSLLFTNSFNLITNNERLTLDNRLIELPSKQPFPIDEYAEYVSSNMNTVNTGYEIQKQQSIIGGIQGVFGGMMQGIIGSAFGGNVMGSISGVGSVASSLTNSILGVSNYEKQIRAKYADAKNVMGDRVLFGATKDTLWNRLINEESKRFSYDICMYRKLTIDSIKQLNNYFLLNGVYNPKILTLNNLPVYTSHLGFKYVKIDSKYINTIFSSYINDSLEVKEMIFNQLSEFRIWDKIPEIK